MNEYWEVWIKWRKNPAHLYLTSLSLSSEEGMTLATLQLEGCKSHDWQKKASRASLLPSAWMVFCLDWIKGTSEKIYWKGECSHYLLFMSLSKNIHQTFTVKIEVETAWRKGTVLNFVFTMFLVFMYMGLIQMLKEWQKCDVTERNTVRCRFIGTLIKDANK